MNNFLLIIILNLLFLFSSDFLFAGDKINFNKISNNNYLILDENLVSKCFADVEKCSQDEKQKLVIAITTNIQEEIKSSKFKYFYREENEKKRKILVESHSQMDAIMQWNNLWSKVNYGCYCGRIIEAEKFTQCPVDENGLDSICLRHSKCYEKIAPKSKSRQASCDDALIEEINDVFVNEKPVNDVYDPPESYREMQNVARFIKALFDLKNKFDFPDLKIRDKKLLIKKVKIKDPLKE